MRQLRVFLEMVKFEHTIFALPFAYLGMVLAARGWPGWRTFLWITVAMAAARTLAFAVNRLADRFYDARNPRTQGRPLPRGEIRPAAVRAIAAAALAVLTLAAWQLNRFVLALLPGAVIFLIGYSYTKRFTWTSHWILGFTDGMAVAGAWAAVTASLAHPAPWLLWLTVTFWMAGFDIIYACQDTEFDRREGLYSVPARFDNATALRLAKANHVVTVLLLAAAGWSLGLGWPFWAGVLAVAGLLWWENSLVKPDDLSRVNVAFFNVNGYISVLIFVAACAGLYV
ncbi:MAG: UbiA-like polyprenyltransferase [Anaerolineae bacterium]